MSRVMHRYFIEALVECTPNGDCGWQLSAEELAFVEHLMVVAPQQTSSAGGDSKRGSVPDTVAAPARGTPNPTATATASASKQKETDAQAPELKEAANNLSPTGSMQFALFTREQFLATLKEKPGKAKAGAGAAAKSAAASGRSTSRAKTDAPPTPTQPAFDDTKAHWTLRILLDADVAVCKYIHLNNLLNYSALRFIIRAF